GKVSSTHEDVSKGSYHTFDIEEGSTIKIAKEWMPYHLELLDEALKEKYGDTLICVIERDAATFAILKAYGFEVLSELEGDVQKKGETEKDSRFYEDITGMIKEYDTRYKLARIVLASPVFWKEEVLDLLKKKAGDIAKKVMLATCHATGKNGIEEVLKRSELKKALADARVSKEAELVEELMREIAKNNLAAYGLEDTHQAVNMGAAAKLLVADEFLQELKRDGRFHSLNQLMKNASRMKAEVHIISSGHDAGKKLLGLGGIAAILRYKIK
ncbi:mRNA surveillance protein pelota, partial [Candidatus Woesearchaeota archaeon]|nr:mRNA surveillance protein pelota [Candidatus Woesearchaeota archaeon]